MANALADETSPYLRQHAENPVDWLPWGPEALRRARDEDKPLLVSVGYSACHWCHVMAHESFEDPAIAARMNELFVPVKVDREERPDVDAVCMEAVQAMTGHGGWPLHVFLTPEQAPLHGGTYFPPEPRQGLPGWPQVLEAVARAWSEQREELRERLAGAAAGLTGAAGIGAADEVPSAELLRTATEALRREHDTVQGGFGGAPRFPPHAPLLYLLRRASDGLGHAAHAGDDGVAPSASPDDPSRPRRPAASEGEPPPRDPAAADAREAASARGVALHTLRSMASGGVHDQVGGGFHRYAVDATWTVPHFEKMLCDNALLARAYAQAAALSGDAELEAVCRRTLAFLVCELRGEEGAFLTALDADSPAPPSDYGAPPGPSTEGAFYVWTREQLDAALEPADAAAAAAWLGVTEAGNLEDTGTTVLEDRGERPAPERAERIRSRLLAARATRPRPGVDDKRLAGWNGLAIAAFAEAGALFDDPELVAVAAGTATAVREHLWVDGRLRRTFSRGEARHDAVLEDHGLLLEGLLVLYEAGGDPTWLRWARELAELLHQRFADAAGDGLWSTADDVPAPVARRKEIDDAPVPAGASAAALGLLRLGALTGEHRHVALAEGQLRLVARVAERQPRAVCGALAALDERLRTPREVAIVGGPAARRALEREVRRRPRPGLVLAVGAGTAGADPDVALLSGREAAGDGAAAHVCERFACRRPVSEVEALRAALDGPA